MTIEKNRWIDVVNNKERLKAIIANRGRFNGYDNETIYKELYKLEAERKLKINFANIINRAKSLCGNIKNTLILINMKLNQNQYEETKTLFSDIIDGILTIQEIVNKICGKEYVNNLNTMKLINDDLNNIVEGYTINDVKYIQSILENNLLPHYYEWSLDIERLLK